VVISAFGDVLYASFRAGIDEQRKDIRGDEQRNPNLVCLTGLTPGAVLPFGRLVLPFDLFVDGSILENDRIAFNARSLTTSIIMSVKDHDYMRVAQPTVFYFSG
jgi:hypothetical protein